MITGSTCEVKSNMMSLRAKAPVKTSILSALHFQAAGKIVVGKEVIKGYDADTVEKRLSAIKAAKPEITPLEDVVVKFQEYDSGDDWSSSYVQSAKIKLNEYETTVTKEAKQTFEAFVNRVVQQAKLLYETLGKINDAKDGIEIE
jgi:hypothetical protein